MRRMGEPRSLRPMSSSLVSRYVDDQEIVRRFLVDGPTRHPGPLWRAPSSPFGWSLPIVAGAWLCFNVYLLSYVTSILVVGWMFRWTRARVLHGWWKQSPLRQGGTFEMFCTEAGRGAVVRRPRWFLPEKGSWTPALWLNFRTGLFALLCITLLLGWGGALMHFGWDLGGSTTFAQGYDKR